MKLVTYKIKNIKTHQIGVIKNDIIFNLNNHFGNIGLVDLIQLENYQSRINTVICEKNIINHKLSNVTLLPPIPKPNSFRDAYAFRQHVETCRRNRGAEMIKEFDEFPVFYFSNHNSMFSDKDDIELMPDHFEKLDFELEFAAIIGKKGKNILSKNADKYIAGFCILNDISARTLQSEEMKLNLGPAKGKDFANVIGPYLVTTDELKHKEIKTPFGKKYDLEMRCYVNGDLISSGNTKDMSWTFAEIIERASYGVELVPGDIIGSGTVGGGCFLEINGTKKRADKNYIDRWLKQGDIIKMEIESIGNISNKIIKSKNDHSIQKLKK
ncbi:MAG: fumarylacetoacetate hydrolase [Flavobacteriales bacterium]|nr:fumarylacetoacetate hydrolase [Flavobacteriales bacterium]|tara:strand:+ start:631 stop:1608 length:978 start_codon:yes stop_codon:yes gene_type:complete